MSDPRRLLEAGSEAEADLLRSAQDDGPSPRARQRTLVALGLGGSIVGATATLSTATAAASTTGLGVFKWIVFGVVSGLVTAGGSHLVLEAREAPTQAATLVSGPSRIVERVHQRTRLALAQTESTAKVPEKSAKAEPARVEPARAEPTRAEPAPARAAIAHEPKAPVVPSAKPSAATLAQEVASLDSAREALSAGDNAKAIDALDRHEKQFKGGVLTPEVEVLRMEALLQRGDRAGAAGAANSFLAVSPNSPYANRVRSILAQATTTGATAQPAMR